MTPADVARVLASAAAFDRRTVGEFDVAAWHKVIGHLPLADAIEAVARHYGNTRQWIMPSDVIQNALALRNERASKNPNPVRELPSRFEKDADRDVRIVDGIAVVAERWKLPEEEPTDLHGIALQRARRERGKRPIPGQRGSRVGGRSPKMPKLAPPPWANPDTAEQQAIQLLHESGKVCGRRSCLRCKS